MLRDAAAHVSVKMFHGKGTIYNLFNVALTLRSNEVMCFVVNKRKKYKDHIRTRTTVVMGESVFHG